MRRFISIILLLLVSGSSFYGGFKLIQDPTGQLVGLNIEWLQHGLFSNYLIPGLVLFFVIGLGSLVSFILTFIIDRRYPLSIILTALVLIVWISIQVFIMQKASFLQPLIGGIGFTLLVLGLLEGKAQITHSAQ